MRYNLLKVTLVLFLLAGINYNCSSPANALLGSLGKVPNLSGATSLLKGAGGLGNLVGKGPFTLLAPSDNALASMGKGALDNLLKPENKDQLTNMLKKYVVPGKLDPTQLAGSGLKDAAGNAFNLGGAKISQSIPTKGGVIQVLDGILK
jgi:uncharacterized surface protein with fasciclin (FAS1) repeats